MKKWSVRLIGCLFFLQALSGLLSLMTGNRPALGVFGIIRYILPYSINNVSGEVDITAWIWVIIIAFTGINLIRLKEGGRQWALILLWPTLIGSCLLFLLTIISSIRSIYFHTPAAFALTSSTWSYKIDNPVTPLLLTGGLLIFYGSVIYFLSGKDTKLLFQKTESIQEEA
jgi:hypothetical protein